MRDRRYPTFTGWLVLIGVVVSLVWMFALLALQLVKEIAHG